MAYTIFLRAFPKTKAVKPDFQFAALHTINPIIHDPGKGMSPKIKIMGSPKPYLQLFMRIKKAFL